MATIRVVKTGSPEDPKMVKSTSDKNKYSDLLDVRDMLSHAVAGNYQDMNNSDLQTNYKLLAGRVGEKAAQKLMNRVFIFNQTQKGGTPTERISRFYETPDGDEEVNTILTNTRGLGQGVIPGFRSSHYVGVAQDHPNEVSFTAAKPTLLRIKK